MRPAFLARKLAAGTLRIGQIVCTADFRIRHTDDADKEAATLEIYRDPADALRIATWNDTGDYRPLKSAPDLRRGWELQAGSLEGLQLALDYLYPAALANARAFEMGKLVSRDLRETLGRQSGMYAVTKKLTDTEADSVILETCDDTRGCLKKILWGVSPGRPTPLTHSVSAGDDPVPLLCPEACCLVVAAARKTVKSRPAIPPSF